MAVYEYSCPKCGKQFELMRPMSEAGKPATCPKCGSRAQRMISGFGSKTGSYVQPTEKPFRQEAAVKTAKGGAKRKTTAKSAASAARRKTAARATGSAKKRTRK